MYLQINIINYTIFLQKNNKNGQYTNYVRTVSYLVGSLNSLQNLAVADGNYPRLQYKKVTKNLVGLV